MFTVPMLTSLVPAGHKILAKNPSSLTSKSTTALSVSTLAMTVPGDIASPSFLLQSTILPYYNYKNIFLFLTKIRK